MVEGNNVILHSIFQSILGLRPRDKAAMLVVNTKEASAKFASQLSSFPSGEKCFCS